MGSGTGCADCAASMYRSSLRLSVDKVGGSKGLRRSTVTSASTGCRWLSPQTQLAAIIFYWKWRHTINQSRLSHMTYIKPTWNFYTASRPYNSADHQGIGGGNIGKGCRAKLHLVWWQRKTLVNMVFRMSWGVGERHKEHNPYSLVHGLCCIPGYPRPKASLNLHTRWRLWREMFAGAWAYI